MGLYKLTNQQQGGSATLPLPHTHPISDIIDLQNRLNQLSQDLQNLQNNGGQPDYNPIPTKPELNLEYESIYLWGTDYPTDKIVAGIQYNNLNTVKVLNHIPGTLYSVECDAGQWYPNNNIIKAHSGDGFTPNPFIHFNGGNINSHINITIHSTNHESKKITFKTAKTDSSHYNAPYHNVNTTGDLSFITTPVFYETDPVTINYDLINSKETLLAKNVPKLFEGKIYKAKLTYTVIEIDEALYNNSNSNFKLVKYNNNTINIQGDDLDYITNNGVNTSVSRYGVSSSNPNVYVNISAVTSTYLSITVFTNLNEPLEFTITVINLNDTARTLTKSVTYLGNPYKKHKFGNIANIDYTPITSINTHGIVITNVGDYLTIDTRNVIFSGIESSFSFHICGVEYIVYKGVYLVNYPSSFTHEIVNDDVSTFSLVNRDTSKTYTVSTTLGTFEVNPSDPSEYHLRLGTADTGLVTLTLFENGIEVWTDNLTILDRNAPSQSNYQQDTSEDYSLSGTGGYVCGNGIIGVLNGNTAGPFTVVSGNVSVSGNYVYANTPNVAGTYNYSIRDESTGTVDNNSGSISEAPVLSLSGATSGGVGGYFYSVSASADIGQTYSFSGPNIQITGENTFSATFPSPGVHTVSAYANTSRCSCISPVSLTVTIT